MVGTELKTDDDIMHFRYELYSKIYVARCIEGNRIGDTYKDYKCAEWIKHDDYKDSIYNVITKAIADCALGRNEFAVDKVKDDVVTFDNKNYKRYTPENWNALVLYNYVRCLWISAKAEKASNKGFVYDPSVMCECRGKLRNLNRELGEKYTDELKRAIKDIEQYDKNLVLGDLILQLQYLTDEGRIPETKYRGKYEYSDLANLGVKVYDVGKGKYRRIRYDLGLARDSKWLSIEIANERLERILAYSSEGIDEIDLTDYMTINKKQRILDCKHDPNEMEIDLSKDLDKAYPGVLIVYHDDDTNRYIDKIQTNDQSNAYISFRPKGRKPRRVTITANKAYTNKITKQRKPVILGPGCFSMNNEDSWDAAGAPYELNIVLNILDEQVRLPNDCKNLFSGNSYIKKITIEADNINNITLDSIAADCYELEEIYIRIKKAPNLKSIQQMCSGNFSLKKAMIRICEVPFIKDMRKLFASCTKLEIVSIDINETQIPERRLMEGMFYDDTKLKRIKWGANTEWIPGRGTPDEVGQLFGGGFYFWYGFHPDLIQRIIGVISAQIAYRDPRKTKAMLNDIIADPTIYDDIKRYEKIEEMRANKYQIQCLIDEIESIDKEKDKDKIAKFKEGIKECEEAIDKNAKEAKGIEERLKEYKVKGYIG